MNACRNNWTSQGVRDLDVLGVRPKRKNNAVLDRLRNLGCSHEWEEHRPSKKGMRLRCRRCGMEAAL